MASTLVSDMDRQPSQQPPLYLQGPAHPQNRVYQHYLWCLNHWWTILRGVFVVICIALFVWQMTIIFKYKNVKKSHSWCKPDFIVSLDGKGHFITISAAVEAVPHNRQFRFCIFIKEGQYYENIFIGPEKTNVVLIGDGIGKTIIVSNRSSGAEVVDDIQLATLLVKGIGFIARDISIVNAAGPDKENAVAVENWADRSIFYTCSFVGYKATLLSYGWKQFYHSCHIKGSRYFIFGNGQAYFQKCTIKAIQVYPDEMLVVAGQLRRSSSSITGFVFHNCDFSTVENVPTLSAHTYLAGSLQAYSMTVVIQSSFDASIAGWLVNDSTPYTVYFGEFSNKGSDAKTRIDSPCVRHIQDLSTASQFSLRVFLMGNEWLPSDIPHSLDIV